MDALPEQLADPIHIQVRGLNKAYGDNHVLRGIDLDLMRSQKNVIIGGSGAGKTVLMRHLVVLERPDAGSVKLDGNEITGLSEVQLGEVRQGFGMVFQGSALFDSMSVFDNVAFPLREHKGITRKEIKSRVFAKLEALGVADAAKRYPSDISGGMRKRVAVARALVGEPAILIYDEPTAGLDPLAARNVDRLVLETEEKFAVTSIIITHDMATCLDTGDRVSMIHEGKIRVTCLPRELMTSDDPAVRKFVEASGVKR